MTQKEAPEPPRVVEGFTVPKRGPLFEAALRREAQYRSDLGMPESGIEPRRSARIIRRIIRAVQGYEGTR